MDMRHGHVHVHVASAAAAAASGPIADSKASIRTQADHRSVRNRAACAVRRTYNGNSIRGRHGRDLTRYTEPGRSSQETRVQTGVQNHRRVVARVCVPVGSAGYRRGIRHHLCHLSLSPHFIPTHLFNYTLFCFTFRRISGPHLTSAALDSEGAHIHVSGFRSVGKTRRTRVSGPRTSDVKSTANHVTLVSPLVLTSRGSPRGSSYPPSPLIPPSNYPPSPSRRAP